MKLPDVAQWSYQRLIRPAVFRVGGGDAEQAHKQMLALLASLGGIPPARAGLAALFSRYRQPVTVAGIDFPGAIGLAAGMDKDGVAASGWSSLGFGFAELGTVTPQAQPGNPSPRLFRLPSSAAIINRMGFNNAGASKLAATLTRSGKRNGDSAAGIPVGISIGKAKETPVTEAIPDYLACFERICDHADYVAVNVSSPNTPGLRALQDRQALTDLLTALVDTADRAPDGGSTPIFVKVAPDLAEDALVELLDVGHRCGISGLIAVNTTTKREGLNYADLALAPQAGGLSGRPLTRRARYVVEFLAARTALPVIGVGGISTAADGEAMLDAGASLLQLFTGFVYQGPALIDQLNRVTRAQRSSPPLEGIAGHQSRTGLAIRPEHD